MQAAGGAASCCEALRHASSDVSTASSPMRALHLALLLHAIDAVDAARRPYDTKVRVASQRSAPLPPTAPQNPTLTEYMRLPTAQYALLDLPYGADLRRKGSSGDQELLSSSSRPSNSSS